MPEPDLKKIVSQVSEAQNEKKKQAEEVIKLLVFELDREEYAVPLIELQSIILIPAITPIPSAPIFIAGIFNLRGKIVVVIDLEKRFGLKREQTVVPKHMIVLEKEGNIYGLMVDSVKEILPVPKSLIQPTPELVSSKIHADYLTGVVVLDAGVNLKTERQREQAAKGQSRLVILLDVSRILQEKELLNLGQKIQSSLKK